MFAVSQWADDCQRLVEDTTLEAAMGRQKVRRAAGQKAGLQEEGGQGGHEQSWFVVQVMVCEAQLEAATTTAMKAQHEAWVHRRPLQGCEGHAMGQVPSYEMRLSYHSCTDTPLCRHQTVVMSRLAADETRATPRREVPRAS